MRSVLKWLSALVAFAALLALAAWAFVEGRRELERERRLERPVEAPRRLIRLPSGEIAVNVNVEAQQSMGLEARALEVAALPREKTAYGKVLDPQPLVALYSELAAGELSLVASRADYERVKSLHEKSQNLSRRALETAEAKYRTDELRVRTALRRISDDWGPSFAELDPASRESLLDRLVRRETSFVRINLPGGEALPEGPTGASVVVFGTDAVRLEADQVLAAPKIDPELQGQAFLLRFDSPKSVLRPGASVTGYLQLPGEPLRALMVPRSAVIRFEGRTWVYVRDGPERFVRRAISLDRPTETGWLTTGVLSESDQVVVVGAQLLLSDELRTEIQVEEEGEK